MNCNVSHCVHDSTISPSSKRSIVIPSIGAPRSPVGCRPKSSFSNVPWAVQRIAVLVAGGEDVVDREREVGEGGAVARHRLLGRLAILIAHQGIVADEVLGAELVDEVEVSFAESLRDQPLRRGDRLLEHDLPPMVRECPPGRSDPTPRRPHCKGKYRLIPASTARSRPRRRSRSAPAERSARVGARSGRRRWRRRSSPPRSGRRPPSRRRQR